MRLRLTGRLVVFLAAAVALAAAGRLLPVRVWIDHLAAWLAGLGTAGLVLYAAAYAVLTVFLMPVFLMTIAAGFFFGLGPGVAAVSAGATLGASAAFLIGRYVARARVVEAASQSPRFAAIDRAVGQKGWRIVFLLRLSPLIPFVLSNYFYGITSVPFGHYVLASWIGMLPITVLYASFGAAARRAASGAPPLAGVTGAVAWIVLGAGAAITIAATIYIRNVARRAIAEERVETERRTSSS
jgi:uncharacterized membrane protein YdjX (TVP38/TMEM64 family)